MSLCKIEGKNQNKNLVFDQTVIEERLLSDVVHKIKNGLGGIGGFATLLDRDIESGDPRKRFVNRIQDTVVMMNEFVVNLMTLTRVLELKPNRIRLPLLIKDVWKNYWGENADGTEKNPVTIDYPENMEDIQADNRQMTEMIYHVIHFIHSIEGDFESIRIESVYKNHIVLLFRFALRSKSKIDLCSIAEIMKRLESVEARLSIGIVQKIARLHQGGVSIDSYSESKYRLEIQIEKGL